MISGAQNGVNKGHADSRIARLTTASSPLPISRTRYKMCSLTQLAGASGVQLAAQVTRAFAVVVAPCKIITTIEHSDKTIRNSGT